MRQEIQAVLARARSSAATARVLTLEELGARLAPGEQAHLRFAALRGRLVELSGSGASALLSVSVGLVREAQLAREPAAWITFAEASFYPPDVAASGVDLAALAVVRVHEAKQAARAAEQLLRSGAFGLVVIDLSAPARAFGSRTLLAEHRQLAMAVQGRLASLAQQHHSAVVCLTEKKREHESLGSLVSLRAEALRERRGSELFISVRALKDKRHGPTWHERWPAHPPDGLT